MHAGGIVQFHPVVTTQLMQMLVGMGLDQPVKMQQLLLNIRQAQSILAQIEQHVTFNACDTMAFHTSSMFVES